MSKRRSITALQFSIPPFVPLSETQKRVSSLFNGPQSILMLLGWAGTGKTYLAMHKALEALQNREVDKILCVRNAVAVRDLGFLPGTEHDKTAPFQAPFRLAVNQICGRDDAYELLKRHGLIEFVCTSYEQGKTYDNCCIVVDEVQNLPFLELDLITTRLGKNSRVVMCGDRVQDYVTRGHERSGVDDFSTLCRMMPDHAEVVEFTKDDIVRSDLVKQYIITREMYFAGVGPCT